MLSKGEIIMFCPNCGSLNDDNNKFCQSCGAKILIENTEKSTSPISSPINTNNANTNNTNYQDIPTFSPAHSIFLIIFSILCFGIFAGAVGAIFAVLSLIEGLKVKDFVATGDIENAKRAKKEANKWIRATYITWAVIVSIIILYFAFWFFVGFISYNL